MFSFFRSIDPVAADMVKYMENHPTGDIFGDTPSIVFFNGFNLGFSRDSKGNVRTIFLNEEHKSCIEIYNDITTKKEIKALEKARLKALYRYHRYKSDKREMDRLEALKNLKVNYENSF